MPAGRGQRRHVANTENTVFENDELIAKQAEGTEKNIHTEEIDEKFDSAQKTDNATHV